MKFLATTGALAVACLSLATPAQGLDNDPDHRLGAGEVVSATAGDTITVYSNPEGSEIASLPAGTIVQAEAVVKNHRKITMPDGKPGYVESVQVKRVDEDCRTNILCMEIMEGKVKTATNGILPTEGRTLFPGQELRIYPHPYSSDGSGAIEGKLFPANTVVNLTGRVADKFVEVSSPQKGWASFEVLTDASLLVPAGTAPKLSGPLRKCVLMPKASVLQKATAYGESIEKAAKVYGMNPGEAYCESKFYGKGTPMLKLQQGDKVGYATEGVDNGAQATGPGVAVDYLTLRNLKGLSIGAEDYRRQNEAAATSSASTEAKSSESEPENSTTSYPAPDPEGDVAAATGQSQEDKLNTPALVTIIGGTLLLLAALTRVMFREK